MELNEAFDYIHSLGLEAQFVMDDDEIKLMVMRGNRVLGIYKIIAGHVDLSDLEEKVKKLSE